MSDDTGLVPRALAPEPCWKCGSSGHFSSDCRREPPRDPRDGYTADEMNAMVRGETTPAELCAEPPAAYVAVRWPESRVVFRLTWDDDGTVYEDLRERVLASVREALDVLGVQVVEEHNA